MKYIPLSARGRGNLGATLGQFFRLGSIPAWAGEPRWEGLPLPLPQVYPRVGGGTNQ